MKSLDVLLGELSDDLYARTTPCNARFHEKICRAELETVLVLFKLSERLLDPSVQVEASSAERAPSDPLDLSEMLESCDADVHVTSQENERNFHVVSRSVGFVDYDACDEACRADGGRMRLYVEAVRKKSERLLCLFGVICRDVVDELTSALGACARIDTTRGKMARGHGALVKISAATAAFLAAYTTIHAVELSREGGEYSGPCLAFVSAMKACNNTRVLAAEISIFRGRIDSLVAMREKLQELRAACGLSAPLPGGP